MSNRFRLYLIFYILAFVVLAAFTAGDYGLSWDEPTRWRSGDRKLSYYEELFVADDKLAVMSQAPNDLYPGFYDVTLSFARKHFGASDFALSRIWNIGFGLFAILVPVALTRILLLDARSLKGRDKWLGDLLPFVSGIALLLCPEFYGHLFMNPKDMPFAASYGWALIALVLLVKELPKPRWNRVVLFAVAVGITMAIRPPGLVVICYFLFFVVSWTILVKRREQTVPVARELGLGLLRVVVSFVVASALLFPFWPRAHRDVFGLFSSSVGGVADLQTVASSQPVLYGGEFYQAGSTPWSYVSWMFTIKQPEWFVGLVLCAIVIGIVRRFGLWQQLREGDKLTWGIFAVGFAFVFPMGFVTVTGSAVHNGFRHMLYVLPMAAVLVGLAWGWIAIRCAQVRRWQFGFVGLTIVFALFSTLQLVRLHPYQYISYNALVGGAGGAYGYYETEYWFTVGQASAEMVNSDAEANGSLEARVFVVGPRPVVSYYLNDSIEITNDPGSADYIVGRPSRDVLGMGKVVGEVSRLGVPLVVVVKVTK